MHLPSKQLFYESNSIVSLMLGWIVLDSIGVSETSLISSCRQELPVVKGEELSRCVNLVSCEVR